MQFAARERATVGRAVAILAAVVAFVIVAAVPATAQMTSTGRVVVVHGLRGRL